MEISFSKSFKRTFKKVIKNKPDLEAKFWEKINLFMVNPFEVSLKTHKLSGQLQDFWSFTIDYDLRVVFYFKENNKAIFTNIGTHNEVY